MHKNKQKNAFTLIEALVTVLILAIVSLLFLSVASNMRPNENIVNAQKAFNTVSKTIQTLTNDSNIYINGTFDSFPSSVNASDKDEYFCNQFAKQLNLKTGINCANISTSDVAENATGAQIDDACGSDYNWANDKYTLSDISKENSAFRTVDGIGWYGLYDEFDGDKYKIICIDVAPDDNNTPAFGVGVNIEGRIVPGEIIKHCLDENTMEQDSKTCPL